MERYDWILLAMFVVLVGGGLIGALTGIPLEYGLVSGFVVATPFVYDALFRNPPLPSDNVQRATAAVMWHALLVILVLAVVD